LGAEMPPDSNLGLTQKYFFQLVENPLVRRAITTLTKFYYQ